jgi:hypothetical protein
MCMSWVPVQNWKTCLLFLQEYYNSGAHPIFHVPGFHSCLNLCPASVAFQAEQLHIFPFLCYLQKSHVWKTKQYTFRTRIKVHKSNLVHQGNSLPVKNPQTIRPTDRGSSATNQDRDWPLTQEQGPNTHNPTPTQKENITYIRSKWHGII